MSENNKKGLPGFLRRSLRIEDDDDEHSSSHDRGEDDGRRRDDDDDEAPVKSTQQQQQQQDSSSSSRSTTTNGRRSSDAAQKQKHQETEDDDDDYYSTAADSSSNNSVPTAAAATTTRKTSSSSTTIAPPPPIPSPLTTTKSNLKRTVSYKEAMLEKTISADVVNVADLRRLCWNGIPRNHRAMAWKLMLGYLPTNSVRRSSTLRKKRQEYRDSMRSHWYDVEDDVRTVQEQETLRQVLVDVPRTAPDVPLFRNERIKQSLTRILYIWAMRHPASSYVQGINDLATPLIVTFLSDYFFLEDSSSSSSSSSSTMDTILDGSVMEDVSTEMMQEIEADCYWCLTNLLAGIQDHYTSDQPGVQRMVMRLEELVTRIDADLASHFKHVGIEFLQFSFKWMNCLLLREFNLKCVCRLWDTYIAEGDGGFEDFHVYVCAAFLCQFSSQLQSMEFDELFAFMQHIPTDDWGDTEVEILLSQAFVLSTLFGGSDAHLVAGSQQTNRS